MKFLCDHMLVRLGRWLRAAGYNTAIILDNSSDQEILNLALKEHRILLTRDRHFLAMTKATPLLIFFKSNSLHQCIQELNEKTQLNWLYHPFSRCLICNTPLINEIPEKAFQDIPDDILEQGQPYWFCPHCQRVYWDGTHVKRMLSQLQAWQNHH